MKHHRNAVVNAWLAVDQAFLWSLLSLGASEHFKVKMREYAVKAFVALDFSKVSVVEKAHGSVEETRIIRDSKFHFNLELAFTRQKVDLIDNKCQHRDSELNHLLDSFNIVFFQKVHFSDLISIA